MHPTLYFSDRRSYEWHDFNYLRTTKSNRGPAISLFMVAWIAAVDLLWPRTNISILYIAPLMLMAITGSVRPLWRSVGVFVLLTYAIYFLKNAISPDQDGPDYFNYRLVNRTLSAVTIAIIGYVSLIWIHWRHDQADPELSESLHHQEREISDTLAIICCALLLALIATIDFLAPANYNLAILYPIPLFICGWVQSRRLLWGMCALVMALTAIAYFLGTPADVAGAESSLARSRILSAAGMVVLSAVLSVWVGRNESIEP